jgi:hypothetical protein
MSHLSLNFGIKVEKSIRTPASWLEKTKFFMPEKREPGTRTLSGCYLAMRCATET